MPYGSMFKLANVTMTEAFESLSWTRLNGTDMQSALPEVCRSADYRAAAAAAAARAALAATNEEADAAAHERSHVERMMQEAASPSAYAYSYELLGLALPPQQSPLPVFDRCSTSFLDDAIVTAQRRPPPVNGITSFSIYMAVTIEAMASNAYLSRCSTDYRGIWSASPSPIARSQLPEANDDFYADTRVAGTPSPSVIPYQEYVDGFANTVVALDTAYNLPPIPFALDATARKTEYIIRRAGALTENTTVGLLVDRPCVQVLFEPSPEPSPIPSLLPIINNVERSKGGSASRLVGGIAGGILGFLILIGAVSLYLRRKREESLADEFALQGMADPSKATKEGKVPGNGGGAGGWRFPFVRNAPEASTSPPPAMPYSQAKVAMPMNNGMYVPGLVMQQYPSPMMAPPHYVGVGQMPMQGMVRAGPAIVPPVWGLAPFLVTPANKRGAARTSPRGTAAMGISGKTSAQISFPAANFLANANPILNEYRPDVAAYILAAQANGAAIDIDAEARADIM
jgi:ribosomal protein L12E/L44/L45/RPP1/RPP2